MQALNRYHSLAIVISSAIIIFHTSRDSTADDTLERWDRAVCLATETGKGDAKKTNSGSGFLIRKDKQLFLVTARHVAKLTIGKTRLLYRSLKGESRWIILGGLIKQPGNPWLNHPNADLSAMPLVLDKVDEIAKESLNAMAIPLEEVQRKPIPRTTRIDVVGFPALIGVRPELSALAMRCHVSSRETKSQGTWGLESVIYTFPVVGDGTSGGPVFLAREDAQESILAGLYFGYILDKTGPKLAKIVPGRVIAEFLDQVPAIPEKKK